MQFTIFKCTKRQSKCSLIITGSGVYEIQYIFCNKISCLALKWTIQCLGASHQTENWGLDCEKEKQIQSVPRYVDNFGMMRLQNVFHPFVMQHKQMCLSRITWSNKKKQEKKKKEIPDMYTLYQGYITLSIDMTLTAYQHIQSFVTSSFSKFLGIKVKGFPG